MKLIKALPISNVDDGEYQTRTINRIYSYITGEKVIPLTISNNVTGGTVTNNSHFTEDGFLVDYLIEGATAWTDASVTNLSGVPVSDSFGSSAYKFGVSPTLTKDNVTVYKLYGSGNIAYGDNSWMYISESNQKLKYFHVVTEYKID